MKNLFNPKWILFITTVPSIVLVILFCKTFLKIHTLLDPPNLSVWKTYATAFCILTIATLGYAILQILKKKTVPIFYPFIILIAYTLLFYGYGFNINLFVPLSIPRWMVPENLSYYAGCFLMPTFIHSLILIILWSKQKKDSLNPWYNLLYALCIPISIYVFVTIISPLWRVSALYDYEHLMIISGVILTILFIYFILKFAILFFLSKKATPKIKLGIRFVFGIVIPLFGIALNNGDIFPKYEIGSGIFGDFSNKWFYILAIANGLFLCLRLRPDSQLKIYEFAIKCALFPFTLYFFLVFMPFLPMSLIAIFAFGIGLLMLAPSILFIIQTNDLASIHKSLVRRYSRIQVYIVAFGSMLIIPTFITFSFLQDKNVLITALDTIYSPDYSTPKEIDLTSLSFTLKTLKDNRRGTDWIMNDNKTPLLSSYFSWLVLDNMTLSNSKIRKIENVYFGTSSTHTLPPAKSHKEVSIKNITSTSHYNHKHEAWETWVDMEIVNDSPRRFAEFGTTIELPEGCWINDYYLFVEGKKEMGILAEKKSAMWVYSQIRNQNRDPGILTYTTGNNVSFRVFPFSAHQTRKTGIKFIHKEQFDIQIDNKKVSLGNSDIKHPSPPLHISTDGATYITSRAKEGLSKVSRTPYFHFILDVSLGRDSEGSKMIETVESILKSYPNLVPNTKITLANYKNETLDYTSDWREKIETYTYEGGLFVEQSIKQILFNAYQSKQLTFPRIVVVTDNMERSIIEKNFADFKMTFPDSDLFYSVNSKHQLRPHSLTKNPKRSLQNHPLQLEGEAILLWPNDNTTSLFLPDNKKPSVIVSNSNKSNEIPNTNPWKSGLHLQGKWMEQCLHPEKANKTWLELVKGSFESRVLTPLTSFIVVENEAQKAVLKQKQEQALNGHKNFDWNKDVQVMSEPNLWILFILFLVYAMYKYKCRILDRINSFEF